MIDFLLDFGIKGERKAGFTGAWVDNRKIASIGIGVRKWVSFHGVAININTDATHFSLIRPCGLDVEMVSLSELVKCHVSLDSAKSAIEQNFKKVFELNF